MIREKPNSGARRRDLMWRKARRKQRLDHELSYWPYYNNLHQYSKNKIHCSCPVCSQKTKKNRHRTYYNHSSWSHHIRGPYNYCIRDMRCQMMMDDQEKEFYIDFS